MENYEKDFLDNVRLIYEKDDEFKELAFQLLNKDFSELTDEEFIYLLGESGQAGFWAFMYRIGYKKED